jgi:type II secretory pathway pseudopilin PulG
MTFAARRPVLDSMVLRMRAGSSKRSADGFTMVALLAATAILVSGLALVGTTWEFAARRQKESELLRVGELYARAIAQYRRVSPGGTRQDPPSLEALLLDPRFSNKIRHIRRMYADPIAPQSPWGLVRGPDGAIRGVFSQSDHPPLRTGQVDLGILILSPAQHYHQWQFIPTGAEQ